MKEICLSMKFVLGGLKLLFVKYAVLTQKCVNRTTDIHRTNRVMKTSIVILFRLCWITEDKRYSFFLWRYDRFRGSKLGRLIVEVSRSHTVRHTQPLGLLWMSDQLSAGGRYLHNTTRDENPCLRRDWNPRSQHSSDFKLLGHRDRHQEV